ncbi:putative ribonuclease H-like domain-containing protein [Tanacetum coccineum]
MQNELLQFKLLNVWSLVDLPRDKWAIGTKWVFRNKKDERGIVVKNKAKLVAQGHTQEEGIDYDEVFAPVARIEAIRLFLAYASFKDFVVYQMDVKSAFLYEKIEEEAPRAWYETLSTYLLDNGFHRGQIDKTLFIRRHKDDILLVQVYVDDIIFGSTKKEMSTEFEKLMHDKFQMSSMGELSFFLGLQVKQKSDGIFISQDKYVAEILKKFDLASIKTASTPMETNKPLTKDEEAENVDVHLYRSMIGSLMYLTASRPDIMFAVCACARFQVTPKTSHLHAVKRIFRYLKGQPKLGLWYPRDSPFDLEAFSDSDYAGASLDRKSTTGGCQFLGKRLISWQCKKQTIVANSTTEAEYVAAANCCGQVLWIQNQMLDYGYNLMNTNIYIDNESTICIVKNPVSHSKTKHIEIRYHFIRDSYEKKLIQVIKIHTDKNVADLLTKAFDVSRTPRYLSLVVLLRKVGDEAVHKELGDRMERAATTASSSEAEQDSGSGPRCQDTILGDVDAQTRFETTSKQSNDPPLLKVNTFRSREDKSDGFAKIIDFLKASSVSYALTVNPIIYTSCIQQFWATTQVKTVNEVHQLQALIDKKKVIIMEASIRNDLHLDDAEEGKDFSGRVTPLFDSMLVQASKEVETAHDEIEEEEHLNTPSNDPLPSGEDSMQLNELMALCTQSDQAIENASLNKRVDKLEKRRQLRTTGLIRFKKLDAEVTLVNEQQNKDLMFDTRVLDDDEVLVDVASSEKNEQSTNTNCSRFADYKVEIESQEAGKEEEKARTPQPMKRRLYKVRVESSANENLNEEDPSKQGRSMIEEIDQDTGVTLVQIDAEDQGRFDDETNFDAGFYKDQVTPTQDSAQGEAHSQEDQPKDHLGFLSAAKVLADAARKNVHTYTRIIRGVSTDSGGISTASSLFSTAKESVSIVGASMPVSTAGMVQEVNISIPSPVVVKDKAMRLQEELDEEERQRMARVHEVAQSFTEEEWENIRARVKADEELAQRLQAEERNKYSEVDQAKMLVNLINQRKKYFATQKAEAKRNKPLTQAQQRNYMTNIGNYI